MLEHRGDLRVLHIPEVNGRTDEAMLEHLQFAAVCRVDLRNMLDGDARQDDVLGDRGTRRACIARTGGRPGSCDR